MFVGPLARRNYLCPGCLCGLPCGCCVDGSNYGQASKARLVATRTYAAVNCNDAAVDYEIPWHACPEEDDDIPTPGDTACPAAYVEYSGLAPDAASLKTLRWDGSAWGGSLESSTGAFYGTGSTQTGQGCSGSCTAGPFCIVSGCSSFTETMTPLGLTQEGVFCCCPTGFGTGVIGHTTTTTMTIINNESCDDD